MFAAIKSLKGPFEDRLSDKAQGSSFRDALAISRNNMTLTPSETQHGIFSHMPNWVNNMMKLRNQIVKLFGFEVGQASLAPKSAELDVGEQAGFMTVSEKYSDEIICAAEDKHMQFYLSVKLDAEHIIVSTLVNKKTFIGKMYVNAILPFHYVIARAVINNARKAGRV